MYILNLLRPRQNGCYFAEDIFCLEKDQHNQWTWLATGEFNLIIYKLQLPSLIWMLAISYAFLNRIYPFVQGVIITCYRDGKRGRQCRNFLYRKHIWHTAVTMAYNRTYMCWRYKIRRLALTISIMMKSLRETHDSIPLTFGSCRITQDFLTCCILINHDF